jgi:flagellar biogenesis protein FliO
MNSVSRNHLFYLLPALLHASSVFGNTVESGDAATLYPTVVSLVLVLGAAAAAGVFLRRWRGSIGRREGPLQLRHVIALGPRERLALVKVGSRYLVVGVTTAGISAVAEFTDATLECTETSTPSERPPAPEATNPP